MSDLEIEIRDIVADVLDIEEPEELDASTEFFGMIQHTTIGDMSKLVAEKLHEQQENVAVGTCRKEE